MDTARLYSEQDDHNKLQLSRPENVSEKAFQSIIRNMKTHRDRERQYIQQKNDLLRKLDREYEAKLSEILGPKLRDIHLRAQAVRLARTERPGAYGFRSLESVAQQLIQLEKLKELGVDAEKLWNVSQDYLERLNLIWVFGFGPVTTTVLGTQSTLLGPALFSPPYTLDQGFGWNDWWCGDGCADLRFLTLGNFTSYKDDQSGTIGSLITVSNLGIDEADAHARGAFWDTNWAFWYTPPTTGPLTIAADLVPLGNIAPGSLPYPLGLNLNYQNNTSWPTPHHAVISLQDQFKVRVYSDEYNNLLSDDYTLLLSESYQDGGDYPPQLGQDTQPVAGQYAITTSCAFPAGVPVAITVGTRESVDISLRHVGVDACVNAKWFMQNIYVYPWQ